MKKVFLSLPMSGFTDEEILENIKFFMQKYLHDDEIPIHNFMIPPKDCGPLYCLGEAIKKMDNCDAIMLHPSWASARGCRIEKEVAEAYGLEVIYLIDRRLDKEVSK